MLGYLLGALLTSIPLGLLIVFVLGGFGHNQHRQAHAEPGDRFRPGLRLRLAFARVLHAERDVLLKERWGRHEAAKGKAEKDKTPPRWQRAISKGQRPDHLRRGSAALLFLGTSYLLGLIRLTKDDLATVPTILGHHRVQPDHAGVARGAAARLLRWHRRRLPKRWTDSRPGCAATVGLWESWSRPSSES